jgi:hypothetical protein
VDEPDVVGARIERAAVEIERERRARHESLRDGGFQRTTASASTSPAP